MRSLVLQENSGDSAVGTSLVGTMNIRPSGMTTSWPLYHNVGLALRVVGADELVGDAQLFAERRGPGFFGEEGIGTGLDQAALDAIGVHGAAEALAALEERVLELRAGGARLFQMEGGAQPGDAAADNGNPLHAAGFIIGIKSSQRWTAAVQPGSRRPAASAPGRQRPHEQRRVVQRFGAIELHAALAGKFAEQDIDVEQDFDVVADEADGLQEDAGVARLASGRGSCPPLWDPAIRRPTCPGSERRSCHAPISGTCAATSAAVSRVCAS